jgi:hypothetical protein
VQLSTVSSLPSTRRENALETERRGWDPRGSTTEREPNSCKINDDLQRYIATATISELNGDEDPDQDMREDSRTELDSHANMPVVGKFAFIISNTGRIADVKAYTPDYDTMQIPIVDAAVKYECPYDGTTYILVIRNALHVPSMQNNLIPPFMIREAGIILNDTPKMQVEHPTVDDHSIYFPETKFRIPMSLWGVFSYFPTSKPTTQDMEESDQVYMLTPSRWDPHQSAYAENEESILDWEGNVIDTKDRQHVLLSDIVEDTVMAASVQIGSIEITAIDRVMESTSNEPKPHPSYTPVPRAADQVSSILAGISPCLDDRTLYAKMEARANLGKFQSAIGSTNATSSAYLMNDDATQDTEPNTDDDESIEDADILMDKLYEEAIGGTIDLDDIMVSAAHASKPTGITAAQLSKTWRIDMDAAERTIGITSQHSQRTDNPTLSRNYGTNDRMLRYKRIHEYFFMDTFFATKKAGKSTRGHSCCQLFVTDKGFVYVVPMKSKSEVLQAVKQFAKEIGAPDAIISDAAAEQKSQKLRKFCSEIGTTLRILEEGTPWANKAELYIGLIKEAVRKDMKESDCPLALWDYCVERRARINNLTAKTMFKLHGTNAYTALTGEEGDISNLCQFKWYDWCYYREHKDGFPLTREILGRVLGPATGAGNEMCQWILKANGNVVPRRTVRPLKAEELHGPIDQKKREIFKELIVKRWGTSINKPPPEPLDNDDDWDKGDDWEEYEDDNEPARVVPDIEDMVDSSGRLLNQQPAYDKLINAEVQLQLGEHMTSAKVKSRALDSNGSVVGNYDDNPMMNSIIYEVEFPDGQVKEYSANTIAENMLTQVDSDGFTMTLMEGIINYRKDEATAVSKADAYVVTQRGQKKLRKTTVGWRLLVKWRDQSESWIHLKDMKESHPVEVAEFAKARGIADEPAFAWWVPYTLRKRDVILSAVKSRIRKTTHKYGIEIPNNITHAHKIDEKSGNSFWRDAIAKEMLNVGIAFEVLPTEKRAPVGWKKVTGHLVWDVKMDFTRKARWVLDGHLTPDIIGSTYAGVVSRESVRIAFTYAALNDVDICAADIRNAYLQAPSSQKDFIICGPEFGLENVGKCALIHRALYGGKSAGADFRNHLRSCMRHLDFVSCPADPDVWMRPAKHSDGSEYYEYILLYTDDALVISEQPEKVLRMELGRYFELKEESIGPPKIYLGGSVRKVVLENGVEAWAFSSSQYVRAAVDNIESYVSTKTEDRWKLPNKAETPLRTSYRPELDVTPELKPLDAAYYQSVIGILRWIVELGRVDICLEVSMMSSHLALPREGHLTSVLQIFSYLKKYHNTEMVFDPSDPVVDEPNFARKDWTSSEFGHIDGKEELPPNMPAPRGQGFVMRAKVDADHAADTVTRRSRTGFLVYLNCAPIYWFSKKQSSVESSSFGSEFVAMKQCCEYLRGLRYKLRMMGIPVAGPVYIQGDNQSVLANTTIPDSTLKKKNQSITYHFVREGAARDEWRTAYVNTHDNDADLLTKLLPSGEKRKGFVRNILHHIFQPAAATA